MKFYYLLLSISLLKSALVLGETPNAVDRYGRIEELKDYKFGVVVRNAEYTIYRSGLLGKKGLHEVQKSLSARGLPFPKTIISMTADGYDSLADAAVQEYLLQRSYGYRFYHAFGPLGERTYLEGADPFHPRKNIDDKKYLDPSVQHLFPLQQHPALDGGTEAFEGILRSVLDPKNQPVLFHCYGGRHRAGMVTMAIRYLQGGDKVEGKKRHFMWRDLNPLAYEYSRFNRVRFRGDNILFVEKVSKMPFFVELQKKYRDHLNLPPL